MQGHGGLAGSRAARHEQHAVVGRADRLVLLALDGGHDVAHPPGALAAQRCQEGAVADDRAALELVGRHRVEQLVLDGDDLVEPAADRAPSYDVVGLGRGSAVERGGSRGAPVDDQRVLLLGADPDAADVVDGPVLPVEATEDQSLTRGVEQRAATGEVLHGHVALVDGLR